MLGASIMIVGVVLAFGLSLKAVWDARDRRFGLAAMVVTSCEAVGLFAAAVWTAL